MFFGVLKTNLKSEFTLRFYSLVNRVSFRVNEKILGIICLLSLIFVLLLKKVVSKIFVLINFMMDQTQINFSTK